MRYDLEKQELETEKNIYKDNATEYQAMEAQFNMRMFFNMWFFISKLLPIKECSNQDEADEYKEDTRKRFFSLQLQKLSQTSGSTLGKVKEELKAARDDHNQMSQEISTLKYELYQLREDDEAHKEKIVHQQVKLECLENQIFNVGKEADMCRTDFE